MIFQPAWAAPEKAYHWLPDMRIPKVLLHPPKKWIFGKKRPILAQNWHFRPNILKYFGGNHGVEFENLDGFLISPQKMDFWPKNGQIWPKTDIFGQILAFLGHLVPCPTINNANKMPWWFPVTMIPKLLLPPVRIRIFCLKTAKLGPKLAFLVIFGQILA